MRLSIYPVVGSLTRSGPSVQGFSCRPSTSAAMSISWSGGMGSTPLASITPPFASSRLSGSFPPQSWRWRSPYCVERGMRGQSVN